jgi:three-Cys-motif partner protein
MWQTTFFERAKSPPTSEKHRLLATAFDAWVAASPVGPRTVFDGFAGAGSFGRAPSSEPAAHGSPLLLLQRVRDRSDGPWRLVFAEKSPTNYARLCEALGTALAQRAGATYVMPSGSVEVRCTTFERCAADLLQTAGGSWFSFVDPYGCDGVRFSTLSALARRGPLVLHLASQALHLKLTSSSGASARQERRMDALLGGAVPWSALRADAASSGAAKQRFAEVLVRGLEREQPGSSSRVTELRHGEAHVLCTSPAP